MSCCFYKGDSLLQMQKFESNTFDLIYINPPFGTTENVWDEKLDWAKYFTEFFRILKPTGMLVIHCSIPFNYTLIREAPIPPSYSWYWNKKQVTCPLLANHQPLRMIEEILVWKKKKNTYYRQQIGEEIRESHFMTPTTYYKKAPKKGKTIIKGKTRTHYIEMDRKVRKYATRPDDMIELIYKSYAKPGDKVLDCFCHIGVSGVIAKRLGLDWVGIDKYFIPKALMETSSF